jgi:hypothetical protein
MISNRKESHMKLTKLLVTGAAVAAIAAPLAQAGNNRVQVAGSFVAPGQTSEAQLQAGHDPATRLVQIGGAFVTPSQISSYEKGLGSTATTTSDSSGIGTNGIVAVAVLVAALLLAAAMSLKLRNRSRLAAAGC